MRNKDSNFWDAIQGISGIYCALISTLGWLYPIQPSQPGENGHVWDGFRMSVPPAWSIGFIVLGVSVAGKAIADIVRRRRKNMPVNQEVRKQMDALLPFSQMAIKHLVLKRGMTEEYFAQFVMDMGFPVITLEQQRKIGNILPQLASDTTLLTKDQQSAQWVVKPEFVNDVARYLSTLA